MNNRKLRAFDDAPRLCIYQANGKRYPFFFSNSENEWAHTINSPRFNEVYKLAYTAHFFLLEDGFAARKKEYMELLENLNKYWVDFHYYLPPVERNEFQCAILCFCKKYSRVFGLRDYTGEMLAKLEFLYMHSKEDALKSMDFARPFLR